MDRKNQAKLPKTLLIVYHGSFPPQVEEEVRKLEDAGVPRSGVFVGGKTVICPQGDVLVVLRRLQSRVPTCGAV